MPARIMTLVVRFGFLLAVIQVMYVTLTMYHQLIVARDMITKISQHRLQRFQQDSYNGQYYKNIVGNSGMNLNKSKRHKMYQLSQRHSDRPDSNRLRELRMVKHNDGLNHGSSIPEVSSQFLPSYHQKNGQSLNNIKRSELIDNKENLEGPSTVRHGHVPREANHVPREANHVARDAHVVPRANVMLLAYRRSGSSFVGEMFNRNPEIFYLFEPFKPYEAVAGHGKFPVLYKTLVHNLLESIVTCSFRKHPFFVNFISSSHFRKQSEILNRVCCASGSSKVCRGLNAAALDSLCSSSSHVVLKTIRANVRDTFGASEERAWKRGWQYATESLHNDYKQDRTFRDDRTATMTSLPGRADHTMASLKVLHLVRDPRAVINSRLLEYSTSIPKMHQRNDMLTRAVRVTSRNLCSRIYSDLQHGEKNWERYALIRYEDAALRPLTAYTHVSRFAGIRESPEVTQWLKKNTKSDKDDKKYYTTTRNSTAAMQGWRATLPLYLVTEVQEQCRELMSILGYVLVRDDSELRNLSKVLILPIKHDIPLQQKPLSKSLIDTQAQLT